MHPLLREYQTQVTHRPLWTGRTIEERCNYPLIYEPGTEWAYACGYEWVGKMIERALGTSLEDYMQSHIWGPLGCSRSTFFPDRKGLEDEMADMNTWEFDIEGRPHAVKRSADRYNYKQSDDALGGAGIFTTAEEFRVFLRAILQADPRLMQPTSYEPLFQEHMGEASRQSMERLLNENDWWEEELGGNIERGTRRAWGMGGVVLGEDVSGWMQQGSVTWKGMSNLVWVSVPSYPLPLLKRDHGRLIRARLIYLAVGRSKVGSVWISSLSSHSRRSYRGTQAAQQAVSPRDLPGLR
jgi:CubicO group peptidase (beta-lactamase class C family)